jgi:hypothetical protein
MENGEKSEMPSLYERMQKLGSLAGFIVDFFATLLSESQVDYWLGHKDELKKKLRELFSINDEYNDEYANVRADWQEFYKKFLGWDVDFSRVIIPQMQDVGKWRLLFIAKGLTMNRVYNAWTFKKDKSYGDIDASVTKNMRTASESYAVWVKDEVEPDQEFLGKSTNQADPNMEIGITLLERMIFEAKYFSETGKHLDIKGATFCSGSRRSGGGVPGTLLDYYDEVFVGWSDLDLCGSKYGIRRAV